MTAQFQKNGKTFTGQIVARGFYNIDKPECFKIEVTPYMTVTVPVSECEVG